MAVTKQKDIPVGEKISMAYYYISHYKITFRDVAIKYNRSEKMVSNILYEVIFNGYLDMATSIKVYNKIVYCNYKGIDLRMKRWDPALNARKALEKRRKEIAENHKRVKTEIEAEIEEIQFQLENWNSSFIDEDDSPSKEHLENRLFRLQRTLCFVG